MFRKMRIRKHIKRLTQGDALERTEAMVELSRIGGPDVVHQVAQVVSEISDRSVQCEAVGFLCRSLDSDALAEVLDASAVESLIEMLGSRDGHVRYTAAATLAHLGEDRWADLVEGSTFEDFERLGQSKDPRMIRPLIRALRDGDEYDRGGAARGLGSLGDKQAVEPLIAALNDPDWGVGCAAAEALGEIGDRRAAEPLWKVTQRGPMNISPTDEDGAHFLNFDSDWFARCDAAISLGKLGDRRAVKPLEAAMPGMDMGPRRTALHVLARLRGEDLPPDIEFMCPNCNVMGLRVPPGTATCKCPNCDEVVPVPKD